MRTCLHCGKTIEGRANKVYCSQSCRVMESAKRNNRQTNMWHIKKREDYNAWQRNYYHSHRSIHLSRVIIRQWIKEDKVILPKVCKVCKATEGLQLRQEQFPTKIAEINEAIRGGKLYYLCRKHKSYKSNSPTNFEGEKQAGAGYPSLPTLPLLKEQEKIKDDNI